MSKSVVLSLFLVITFIVKDTAFGNDDVCLTFYKNVESPRSLGQTSSIEPGLRKIFDSTKGMSATNGFKYLLRAETLRSLSEHQYAELLYAAIVLSTKFTLQSEIVAGWDQIRKAVFDRPLAKEHLFELQNLMLDNIDLLDNIIHRIEAAEQILDNPWTSSRNENLYLESQSQRSRIIAFRKVAELSISSAIADFKKKLVSRKKISVTSKINEIAAVLNELSENWRDELKFRENQQEVLSLIVTAVVQINSSRSTLSESGRKLAADMLALKAVAILSRTLYERKWDPEYGYWRESRIDFLSAALDAISQIRH